jgi:hypothetical protein
VLQLSTWLQEQTGLSPTQRANGMEEVKCGARPTCWSGRKAWATAGAKAGGEIAFFYCSARGKRGAGSGSGAVIFQSADLLCVCGGAGVGVGQVYWRLVACVETLSKGLVDLLAAPGASL